MFYLLEQGPHEKKILEQAKRTGLPIPDKIANAPSLELGLGLYMEAWMNLTTCRNSGMSEGSIPWTAIQFYADTNEFNEDQTEALHHHIASMDERYFKYKADKQ